MTMGIGFFELLIVLFIGLLFVGIPVIVVVVILTSQRSRRGPPPAPGSPPPEDLTRPGR